MTQKRSGHGAPVWTEAEKAELLRLHKSGVAPTAIVAHMGHRRTRNAVIGMLDRLGRRCGGKLVPKPAKAKRNRMDNNPSGITADRLRAAKAQGGRSKAPEPLPPTPPGAPSKSIANLGSRQCRFIGERPEVLTVDTPLYCGQPGYPWCPAHRAIVYQPARTVSLMGLARLK